MKNIHNDITYISLLIYLLPKRYIKRYKRKYLGWLQGETRKLHKISKDKNLTEPVHKKISHTIRNLAWCETQRWELNTRVALVAGLNPTPYGTS